MVWEVVVRAPCKSDGLTAESSGGILRGQLLEQQALCVLIPSTHMPNFQAPTIPITSVGTLYRLRERGSGGQRSWLAF